MVAERNGDGVGGLFHVQVIDSSMGAGEEVSEFSLFTRLSNA